VGSREIILPYAPRKAFMPFHLRTERWSCLVAHRRAGKTVAAINDLIKRAITEGNRQAQYAYIAPFRSQAKRVAWDYIKYYAAPITKSTNESDLMVELVNGAKIMLFGSDNADAMRGLGFNGVYLDEYGDFKPSVWGNVIRPTLSDRLGWAVFGGTPKGKNQFHDIYRVSQATPDWFLLRLPASASKLLPDTELRAAREQLSQDQYDQEYECSFDAAILGAFYGLEMRRVDEEGRIKELPFEPESPVYTAWDLGVGDSTAIWVCQVAGQEKRLVNYYENHGVGLDNYVRWIKENGYATAEHILPHDVEVRELGTGKSRKEALQDLGLNIQVCPRISVDDGIQAVRRTLPFCWFHPRTKQGLDALKNYRREYDEKRNVFYDKPLHDYSSHGADAFRYLAVGLNTTSDWGKPLAVPTKWIA